MNIMASSSSLDPELAAGPGALPAPAADIEPLGIDGIGHHRGQSRIDAVETGQVVDLALRGAQDVARMAAAEVLRLHGQQA